MLGLKAKVGLWNAMFFLPPQSPKDLFLEEIKMLGHAKESLSTL